MLIARARSPSAAFSLRAISRSLSFVFSATAQEVLGSCIFLFVKHPFDVGDRVDIGDNQLLVERISLLFTIFRKVKDHKTTQVPNIVLNSNWIDNVTRSKAMREQVLLYVNSDTSLEDIELLKREMLAFVRELGIALLLGKEHPVQQHRQGGLLQFRHCPKAPL